jgi:AcrR family transcriptional regulator
VRVEKLARGLQVTKGSFYWHFKDREEILEALLSEWEEETAMLTAEALSTPDRRQGLRRLLDNVKEAVVLSERGEAPSDAAMFAWASMSQDVARRVNQVEKKRLHFFTELTGRPDRAELAYYAYLGFITRRRRVPGAAAGFPLLAEMIFDLLVGPHTRRSTKSRSRKSHESIS